MRKLCFGICDHNIPYRLQLQKVLSAFCDRVEVIYKFIFFDNVEEAKRYQGIPIDILLTEIKPSGDKMDGIELAKYSELHWPQCKVIFYSSQLSDVTEIFKTNFFFFILKSELEQRLPEIFAKMHREYRKQSGKMSMKIVGGKDMMISPNDIYYIEKTIRYSMIHSVWGDCRVKEKIEEIEEMLPQFGFVKTHSSYLVNLNYVMSKNRNQLTMMNDVSIPISRRYEKHVTSVWERYSTLQERDNAEDVLV